MRKLRVVVTGSRDWKDLNFIKRVLQPLLFQMEVLIEGEAPGADILCKQAALELGYPKKQILEFPADWDRYHRAAGPIRNQQMIIEGKPNYALAFHENLEKSKGTRDMIDRLSKAQIETRLFRPRHKDGLLIIPGRKPFKFQ